MGFHQFLYSANIECYEDVKSIVVTFYVNPFQNKPWFLLVCSKRLLKNTVGKGEIAHNEQFLLFSQCFLPVEELSAVFIRFEIVVCKLSHFGRV